MYIVVGGNPFRGYTNTLTFTSLKVVGKASSQEELKKLVEDNYEACAGLMIVIDSSTGKEVTF